MFKRAGTNQKAQVMVSEYALVLFIVLGVMATMTIYFRRALQARIFDARNAMLRMIVLGNEEISNATHIEYDHDFVEYEPYYLNTYKIITRDSSQTTWLVPTRYGEENYQSFNDYTNVQTTSVTAPPKDAR